MTLQSFPMLVDHCSYGSTLKRADLQEYYRPSSNVSRWKDFDANRAKQAEEVDNYEDSSSPKENYPKGSIIAFTLKSVSAGGSAEQKEGHQPISFKDVFNGGILVDRRVTCQVAKRVERLILGHTPFSNPQPKKCPDRSELPAANSNSELYGTDLCQNLTRFCPIYNVINFLYNMLYGDLSFMFGSNKTVHIAEFSNMLEFNLNNVVFPSTLAWLDSNHNNIYRDLLVGLTRLDLQYLDVSYNRLPNSL
ncbi:hypothetical protein RHGRI_006284 [Rhododendron griersonianum]|uniref:Uncharacterized protein n=1 Tax=Rhododendron griersonianum TaxID=479676 RepID=A0AAV6KTK3_9ERIC|nr:hypothetical protein RHGRI_006284 [Rhododendron griersonianum]